MTGTSLSSVPRTATATGSVGGEIPWPERCRYDRVVGHRSGAAFRRVETARTRRGDRAGHRDRAPIAAAIPGTSWPLVSRAQSRGADVERGRGAADTAPPPTRRQPHAPPPKP